MAATPLNSPFIVESQYFNTLFLMYELYQLQTDDAVYKTGNYYVAFHAALLMVFLENSVQFLVVG